MTLKFSIPEDVTAQLPQGGATYLEQLATVLDPDAVRSVLLFGSVVMGEATDVSDVDVIIVVENDVSDRYIESVRTTCDDLARQHLDTSSEADRSLERIVDRHTGMFRSGFVTRMAAIESGRFHEVFNTSRIAYVVAPWRSVFANVFASIVSIYGPAVTPEWTRITSPVDRPIRELTKSWVMTFVLAVAQLFYALISPRAIQYSMEAYKWTLYTCGFHLRGAPVTTLAEAQRTVPTFSLIDQRFNRLRDHPVVDLPFILVTPILVSLYHARTLWAVLGRRPIGAS